MKDLNIDINLSIYISSIQLLSSAPNLNKGNLNMLFNLLAIVFIGLVDQTVAYNATSLKYSFKLNMPLRRQWEENEGYCGEVIANFI